MSELELFHNLNTRLTQIVEELTVVEEELTKLMRPKAQKREYWTIRVTFPVNDPVYEDGEDGGWRTRYFSDYRHNPSVDGFSYRIFRAEMSEREARQLFPKVKKRAKKELGEHTVVTLLKVKVFSRS